MREVVAVAEQARRRKARNDQNEPRGVGVLAILRDSVHAKMATCERRALVCLSTPVVTTSSVLPLRVRVSGSA